MDAITLLKNDHKTAEALFKRFEKAGPRAYVEKREVTDRIIEELSQHAVIEEQFFYPATRATVSGVEGIALESMEEHHIVKWVLSELEDMDPETDERFDAKMSVLIENVRHHVTEEEGEYLPQVREALGRNALNELGDTMEVAKGVAPTRPHPSSPQRYPANVVVGTAAGALDRVFDTVSGIAQGGVSAVGDLVSRVRGTKPRQPAPTGSTMAREVAESVRSGSNDALDQVISAIRDAEETGEEATDRAETTARETAKAAKTGAKRAAGSAGKGASQTKTTAKQGVTNTARTAKRNATSDSG